MENKEVRIPPVPLETLPEQLSSTNFLDMEVQDYMVAFSGRTKSYCVGVVDMVGSTKISASLSSSKSSKYYALFLNTMARILNRFGAMVIKNVGDSLLFYFPESSKNRSYGYMTSIEGCLGMVEAHAYINELAKKEGLPKINYRISCDFGPVMIMKDSRDSEIDLIGPPMNISSKINRLAPNNGFVIGGDFYEVAKKLDEYEFSSHGNYDLNLKSQYSVYLVSRK